MKDLEAMKTALANIKKLARSSVVERYKSKSAKAEPKAEAKAEHESESSSDEEVEGEMEDEPMEDEPKHAMTEIIITSGGRRPADKKAENIASMMDDMPMPKRGRGRPKGSLNKSKG